MNNQNQRLQTRKSFKLFLFYIFKNVYKKNLIGYERYAYRIVETLQKIVDGELRNDRGYIKNVIITIPPRFGKSEIANIGFISWVLANNPRAKFLTISSSAKLSSVMVGKCLDIINSKAYQFLAPHTRISKHTKSRTHFVTTERGEVGGIGAGGTITGRGAGTDDLEDTKFAGAVIIDDPLQASKVRTQERQNINEWFFDAVFSRRNSPNTPFIIIQQRLHHNDLVGYILKDADLNDWEIINIPALDEDGNSLLEERMPKSELEILKRKSPDTFYTQYQQDVTTFQQNYIFSPEGVVFLTKEQIKDIKPILTFITTDFAVSSKENADYTCFLYWYVFLENNEPKLYLKDFEQQKLTPTLAVDCFMNFIKNIYENAKDNSTLKPKYVFFENVTQTSIYKDFLEKNIANHNQNNDNPIRFINATADRNRDKITRFREVQYPFLKYKLHLDSCIQKNYDLTQELFDITNDDHENVHDDLTDCVTDAFYYTYIDRGLWDAEIETHLRSQKYKERTILDDFLEELRALN